MLKMNVKELIEELQQMNPDSEVIIQKDSEGNSYSPCAGADADAIYIADSTWSGHVYDSNWSFADADMEEKEWKKMLKLPRACVLFPVN
jgi:hypothetical protein